ncbi:DUF58 domain-containing protein [Rhodobacteraceae bacterium NNCM2]|nr:DUF58 domain-containing protein [Coraliihabitans acroporae]
MPEARDGIDVSFDRLIAARRQRGGTDWDTATDNLAGGFSGKRRGQGLEIRDLRQFAPGDDIRYLDASVTARTGKPHVRTFHEEQDKVSLLVADFRRPTLWGTSRRLRSVAAAEALAQIGWQMVEAGGKVGLLVIRDGQLDHVPPRARARAMLLVAGMLERSHRAALEAAMSGEYRVADTLTTGLERASRLVAPGAAVICATSLDAPGPDFGNVAGSLARRLRLSFLLVRDKIDSVPPSGPFAYANSAGETRWGRFPTTSSRSDEAYSQIMHSRARVFFVDTMTETPGIAPASRAAG